ncbi:MAG: 3-deoxy-manno-octulosonate cytidylyltransferase [Pseudomonadota bacterium]
MESMHVSVVIPARLASTRLPGKVLKPLAGKPMVQHVWERAVQADVGDVLIATDDARVAEVARAFGAQVEMTAADHSSGTDRIAEVAARRAWAAAHVVVNVQGDEPLIPPANIAQVARNLSDRPGFQMATLAEPLGAEDLHNPGAVKVTVDRHGRALYFSRATIPWYRDAFASAPDAGPPPASLLRRHIGIYAYRAGFLAEFVAAGPCELERAEALEQLRALFHGAQIHVDDADELPGPGVDTQRDLARAEQLLASGADTGRG